MRDTVNGVLAWDKKKNSKPNKSSTIVSVEASPAVRSAKEWFELIDEDRSGELDQTELATLYQRARGEKLKGKQVCMLTLPSPELGSWPVHAHFDCISVYIISLVSVSHG